MREWKVTNRSWQPRWPVGANFGKVDREPAPPRVALPRSMTFGCPVAYRRTRRKRALGLLWLSPLARGDETNTIHWPSGDQEG